MPGFTNLSLNAKGAEPISLFVCDNHAIFLYKKY